MAAGLVVNRSHHPLEPTAFSAFGVKREKPKTISRM
jgi:hypothetical protein